MCILVCWHLLSTTHTTHAREIAYDIILFSMLFSSICSVLMIKHGATTLIVPLAGYLCRCVTTYELRKVEAVT